MRKGSIYRNTMVGNFSREEMEGHPVSCPWKYNGGEFLKRGDGRSSMSLED